MTADHGYTPAAPMPEADATRRKGARRAYNRAGLGIFLFILIPQAIVLVASVLVSLTAPAFLDSIYYTWFMQVFALYMTATPIALLVIGAPPKELPEPEKKSPSPLLLLSSACLMLTVAVAGSLISTLLMGIMEMITGHTYSSTVDALIAESPVGLVILIVCIIGPIVEELVFRRALMRRLLPYGEVSAILISGITFGVMHGNFFQLFSAIGSGLVLAYLYARTRNFLYPVLLHILYNLWAVLPSLLFGEMPSTDMAEEELYAWIAENLLPYLGMMLYSLAMYAVGATGLILLLVFIRRVRFDPCPLPLPREEGWRIRLLNPGMILFAVLSLLLLLLSFVPM